MDFRVADSDGQNRIDNLYNETELFINHVLAKNNQQR